MLCNYLPSDRPSDPAKGLFGTAVGLGSYLTAWSWLHKLRRAMVRPGRGRLAGKVEVDETLLGGVAWRKVRGVVAARAKPWSARPFPTECCA